VLCYLYCLARSLYEQALALLAVKLACKEPRWHLADWLLLLHLLLLLLPFVQLVALLQHLLLDLQPSSSLCDVLIELVPYGYERLAATAIALEALRVREGEDLVCEHKLPLIKLVNPTFIQAPYMQPDELERVLV